MAAGIFVTPWNPPDPTGAIRAWQVGQELALKREAMHQDMAQQIVKNMLATQEQRLQHEERLARADALRTKFREENAPFVNPYASESSASTATVRDPASDPVEPPLPVAAPQPEASAADLVTGTPTVGGEMLRHANAEYNWTLPRDIYLSRYDPMREEEPYKLALGVENPNAEFMPSIGEGPSFDDRRKTERIAMGLGPEWYDPDGGYKLTSAVGGPISNLSDPKEPEPADLLTAANAMGGQVPTPPPSATPIDSRLRGVLAGKGELFERIGAKHGVDPKLLASIAIVETGNGTSRAARELNNVGGMMDPKTDWEKLLKFPSLEEGLDAMASNLRRNYIERGRTTVDTIQPKYTPVGAKNDVHGTNHTWSGQVKRTMAALGGDPDGSVAIRPQPGTGAAAALPPPRDIASQIIAAGEQQKRRVAAELERRGESRRNANAALREIDQQTAAAVVRAQSAQTSGNIDPLSPQGIAATVEKERRLTEVRPRVEDLGGGNMRVGGSVYRYNADGELERIGTGSTKAPTVEANFTGADGRLYVQLSDGSWAGDEPPEGVSLKRVGTESEKLPDGSLRIGGSVWRPDETGTLQKVGSGAKISDTAKKAYREASAEIAEIQRGLERMRVSNDAATKARIPVTESRLAAEKEKLATLIQQYPGIDASAGGTTPTTSSDVVYKTEAEARAAGRKSGDVVMMINPATGKPARARLK